MSSSGEQCWRSQGDSEAAAEVQASCSTPSKLPASMLAPAWWSSHSLHVTSWVLCAGTCTRSVLLKVTKVSGVLLWHMCSVGVVSGLRQLLEFGLFHGDPHPGNIFCLRDGRIAYVDFGNVAQLSNSNKQVGAGFPCSICNCSMCQGRTSH